MNLLNTIIILIVVLLISVTFVNKNWNISNIFNIFKNYLDITDTKNKDDINNSNLSYTLSSNTNITSSKNKDDSSNKEIYNINKILQEEKKVLSSSDLSKIFKLILKRYQFSDNRFLLLKKKTYFFLECNLLDFMDNNYKFFFLESNLLDFMDNNYKYLNGKDVNKYSKRFYLVTLIIYFFILNQNLKTQEDIFKDFFDLNGDIYTILSNNDYVIDYKYQLLLVIPQNRNNIITKQELTEVFSILKKRKHLVSIFDIINIGKYYNQLNYQRSKYNNTKFKKYCCNVLNNDSQLSYYSKINNLLNIKSKKNNEIGNRYLRNKNWEVPRQWLDKYGPNYLLYYYR